MCFAFFLFLQIILHGESLSKKSLLLLCLLILHGESLPMKKMVVVHLIVLRLHCEFRPKKNLRLSSVRLHNTSLQRKRFSCVLRILFVSPNSSPRRITF